jgi:hypothetical protein
VWSVIAIFLLYGCFVVGLSLPIGADLIVTHLDSTGLGIGMATFGAGAGKSNPPPSIQPQLADALGVSPATAMRHANLAGVDFLRYARSAERGLRPVKPTVG